MLRLSRSIAHALLASPVALLALAAAPAARADVLPPNDCQGSAGAGDPCTVAGPQMNEDGTCEPMTCTRRVVVDGGFSSEDYTCFICELPDAGSMPTDLDGGPSADATVPETDAQVPATEDDAAASASAPRKLDAATCSVGMPGARAGDAGTLFALGGLGLVLSAAVRRRRR